MMVPLEDVAAEVAIALRLICEDLLSFETPQSIIHSLPRLLLDNILKLLSTRCWSRDDDYAGDSFKQLPSDRQRHGTNSNGLSWLWDASALLISRRKNELMRRMVAGKTAAAFDDPALDDAPIIEERVYAPTSPHAPDEDAIALVATLSSPNLARSGSTEEKVSEILDQLEQGPIRNEHGVFELMENNAIKQTRDVTEELGANYAEEELTSRIQQYHETMIRLEEAKVRLVDEFMATRRDYIWGRPIGYSPSPSISDMSHLQIFNQSFTGNELPSSRSTRSARLPISGKSSKVHVISAKEFKVMVDENHHMRNVNPRSAYVHRLSEIIRSFRRYDSIFSSIDSPSDQSQDQDIETAATPPATVAASVWSKLGSWCKYGLLQLRASIVIPSSMSISLKSLRSLNYRQLLEPYIQPMKIATAIVLTSLLVVIPYLADRQQNGLWAVVVITLIRQDNTSSSFLVGYQRLEGTVLGAVYAFTVYQALNCDNSPDACAQAVTIPVLLIWLALCSFFREGPRHGYASIVAGFTPIVLFLGPVAATVNGAWLRVQKTFIGVAVYLVIDNLILPNRTGTAARQGVLQILDTTIGLFNALISGVKPLVDIGEGSAPRSDSKVRLQRALSDRLSSSHYLVQKLSSFDVYMSGGGQKLQHNSSLDDSNLSVAEDPFFMSSNGLKIARQLISSMQKILIAQSAQLAVVIHEPELWHRPFPIAAYTALHNSFQNLVVSARDVCRGGEAFGRVLQQMTLRDEDVWQQIHFYEFMSKRIFAVASRTSAALRMTSVALHRLYEDQDLRSDLSPLITLSRYFDRLLQEVDDHFKDLFITHDAPPIDVNPYFLLAWQNIFEALCDLLKNLSELGIALHAVRNIEALNAT
jgi:hypothetical protein